MKELNAKAVEIEFLVISVIQGFAIQALAVSASEPISNLRTEYWFYIASAFILILIFWTQAIIHALSFIRWPIDIIHTFLYLFASIVEVMAFTHITNPLKWFIFSFFFLISSAVMYIYDLSMIYKRKKDFLKTKELKKLYEHMYTVQVREMKLFIPSSLLYAGVSAILIFIYPRQFIDQNYHVILSGLQLIFGIMLLILTVKTFKERSSLLENRGG